MMTDNGRAPRRSNPYFMLECAACALAVTGIVVGMQQIEQGRSERLLAAEVTVEPTEVSYEELIAHGTAQSRHIKVTHFRVDRYHAFRPRAGVEGNGVAYVPLHIHGSPLQHTRNSPSVIARFSNVGEAGGVRRMSEQRTLTGLLWDSPVLSADIRQELLAKNPALNLDRFFLLDIDAPLPVGHAGERLERFGYILVTSSSLMLCGAVIHLVWSIYRRLGGKPRKIRGESGTTKQLDAGDRDRQVMLESLMGRPLRPGRDPELTFCPTANGFVVVRAGRRMLFEDHEVEGLSFAEVAVPHAVPNSVAEEGRVDRVRRTLKIRTLRAGVETIETGSLDLDPAMPDPLGLLYVRLLGTLEIRAWQTLQAGGTVRGGKWRIEGGKLRVQGRPAVPFREIVRTGWRAGTLSLWRRNEMMPFACLDDADDNVVLLSQLAKRLLADVPQEAPVA